MGRPKRVFPEKLHEFNIMHTEKQKMLSGVEITVLHLLKKTKEWFISLDTWAFCCSKFKRKHKNLTPKVDLPVCKDEKTSAFLNEHAWHDWVDKYIEEKGELREGIDFLNKLYPNHKKVKFYELESIIGAYCWGSFVSYDEEGNEVKKLKERYINKRKYYNWKYFDAYGHEGRFPKHIQKMRKDHRKLKYDTPEGKASYIKFRGVADKYILENHDFTPIFKVIGENSIVIPYAFTEATVKGSAYEHAGELYLVVTDDTVYFEIDRHF